VTGTGDPLLGLFALSPTERTGDDKDGENCGQRGRHGLHGSDRRGVHSAPDSYHRNSSVGIRVHVSSESRLEHRLPRLSVQSKNPRPDRAKTTVPNAKDMCGPDRATQNIEY
jgi:hypothetical protein